MTRVPDPTVSIPIPPRREVVRELHGDRRVDGYGWLCDTSGPGVIAHLAAERSYYEASTAHLHPLVEDLSSRMRSRVPDTDSSVSYRRSRYSYYNLTPTGSEYEQLWRGRDRPQREAAGTDQLLVDPECLRGDSSYVEIGVCEVSPDERLLAYSVDTVGDEVYRLRFRDLEAADGAADLPDIIERSYYGGAWSADSSTFFYTVHDDAYRPYQVWRHRLGTPSTADVLVFAEADERYEVDVRGTRSGDLIVLRTANRDTSEVWLVNAHHPEEPARCVQPREAGMEYSCEHVRPGGSHRLLLVTNFGAQEFRMMSAPLDDPGRRNWVEVLPENPAERLYDVSAFAGHVVTTLRRDAVLCARSYRLTENATLADPVDLTPTPVAGTLQLGRNERFDTDEVQIVEESWIHPKSWFAVNLDTGERRHLLTRDVPGYDATRYVAERRWLPVPGADVPVTLVRHVDTPLDGTAPCLLYGYGAYEACFDPEFDATLSVLLDEGVVWAHAGIRGGGEGGRRWWLNGRLGSKQNTFSDHISVADQLADEVVDSARIVTRGLSAGGLLQGAVFSQAPQRWAGVIAEVPFVDVVTTMLDPSIPLTVNEWDEWGDPRRPQDYAWMRAYSPYDNIPAAGSRPPLLATGALHDPRVMVCEPAKWVAELRRTDPEWAPQCLFRAETGAGAHVGPSGRYAHVKYEAEIYAWALQCFSRTNDAQNSA